MRTSEIEALKIRNGQLERRLSNAEAECDAWRQIAIETAETNAILTEALAQQPQPATVTSYPNMFVKRRRIIIETEMEEAS